VLDWWRFAMRSQQKADVTQSYSYCAFAEHRPFSTSPAVAQQSRRLRSPRLLADWCRPTGVGVPIGIRHIGLEAVMLRGVGADRGYIGVGAHLRSFPAAVFSVREAPD